MDRNAAFAAALDKFPLLTVCERPGHAPTRTSQGKIARRNDTSESR